jgi:anti-sigma-K factor RskA
MSDHEAMRELLAPVALGAATPEEELTVEAHARRCEACAAELAEFRAAAGQLAVEVPQVEPPPELKKRVMDAVREEIESRPAPLRPARRGLRGWARPWAVAAVLAVAVAALIGWNVALQNGGGEGRVVAVSSPAGAAGTVRFLDDGGAIVRVRNLPPPGSGRGYELWTIRGGRPRSEGFASIGPNGEVVVSAADLDGASAMAITPERLGNVRAPTGPQVVVIPL